MYFIFIMKYWMLTYIHRRNYFSVIFWKGWPFSFHKKNVL